MKRLRLFLLAGAALLCVGIVPTMAQSKGEGLPSLGAIASGGAHGVATAARETGQALRTATTKTGDALGTAASATGNGLKTAAGATGHSVATATNDALNFKLRDVGTAGRKLGRLTGQGTSAATHAAYKYTGTRWFLHRFGES